SAFESLKKQAKALHGAQTGSARISLDAIFTSLAIREAVKRRRKTTEEGPPQWFADTLAKLKGSGEKITVTRFLLLAGRFPASRADSLAVGRWLREAGHTPRKTGGQNIFEFD